MVVINRTRKAWVWTNVKLRKASTMYLLSVTYAAIYGLTIVCSLQQAMLARCKNEIAECQGGICLTAGDACQ